MPQLQQNFSQNSLLILKTLSRYKATIYFNRCFLILNLIFIKVFNMKALNMVLSIQCIDILIKNNMVHRICIALLRNEVFKLRIHPNE